MHSFLNYLKSNKFKTSSVISVSPFSILSPSVEYPFLSREKYTFLTLEYLLLMIVFILLLSTSVNFLLFLVFTPT